MGQRDGGGTGNIGHLPFAIGHCRTSRCSRFAFNGEWQMGNGKFSIARRYVALFIISFLLALNAAAQNAEPYFTLSSNQTYEPGQKPQISVWAANVVRVLPGEGVQAWSRPAGADVRPEGMGLLQFEGKK